MAYVPPEHPESAFTAENCLERLWSFSGPWFNAPMAFTGTNLEKDDYLGFLTHEYGEGHKAVELSADPAVVLAAWSDRDEDSDPAIRLDDELGQLFGGAC